MKTNKSKIAAAALAALAFATPLGASVAYADPPRHSEGYDRHDNRRDNNRRADNRRERWDTRRHNGYSLNGRWYYGPPPSSYYGRADFHPGYRAWRRGDRLPNAYRSQYVTVDYRRAHLRAPPRGYHYVRDNRGEVLLVGIATGIILGVIASN
jgi:Ni/Co efflux regulator RcnB